MAKFVNDLIGSLTDAVDWIIHKLTTILLTVTIIGVLLLSLSSNYYIRELMSFQINRVLIVENKISNFYDKFIKLSIKTHTHKERMYRLLNDINVSIVELNLSIDKMNSDKMNFRDNRKKLKDKALIETKRILDTLEIFRDEFATLNSVIEEAIEITPIDNEIRETDL